MKYKQYVGIIDSNNKISYVTRTENSTKTFYCEKGKEAKVFTKTGAEDLVYCLVINNYNAVVLRVPDFYNYVNSSEEKDCKVDSDKWISVESKLPDMKTVIAGESYFAHVLTLTDDKDYPVRIAYYDSELKEWFFVNDPFPTKRVKVTHWMVLPKLPER